VSIVLQGFWKKYCPNAVRRGDFFQNLYNLAGQRARNYLCPMKSGLGKETVLSIHKKPFFHSEKGYLWMILQQGMINFVCWQIRLNVGGYC
jgi:hypothetical protein